MIPAKDPSPIPVNPVKSTLSRICIIILGVAFGMVLSVNTENSIEYLVSRIQKV